jgi:uncharacterized protein (DUF885 family)
VTDVRTDEPTPRERTAADALAERYLDEALVLDPLRATQIGAMEHSERLPDFSPDGLAARAELDRRTLAQLESTEPADDIDRTTIAALRDRLGVSLALHEMGADEADLNVIASAIQNVRSVFDIMPSATPDDWAVIATRLAAVPAAFEGYATSLLVAAGRGNIAPRRQVIAAAQQCRKFSADDGFFANFVAGAKDSGDLPPAIASDLEEAGHRAARAYAELGELLDRELLDRAPERDACGREPYQLWSRAFVGAEVDLDDAYAWGQEELARIVQEMEAVADQIKPGATVPEAIDVLDRDPATQLHNTGELLTWMQGRSDEAVAALAGTHFDIPEPIRRLECRIAPTTVGGIYYTGPSDDFSRPGRMWWSVPPDVTSFSTWRELTTVYHEGVPGHHLQVAQTVYRRELLNRWRRLDCWVSGHGEGWALYAERLMADLGFLDDPGARMGMLDGQSLRAARVVLDIGVHCELPAPTDVGGGAWDYDKAWRFLTSHSFMATGFLRFELDRYLGWPGQAPSYKLGERFWLQMRDAARERAGADFDLKEFHRRALDVGSVPLDVLREAVLRG